MKVVRLMVTFVALGVLALAAGADDKADNAKMLVGSWEVTKVDKDGGLPVGAVADFGKDGKVKVTFKKGDKEESHEGTYKVDGDKLVITMKDPEGKERERNITIKKCSETECVTESDGKTIEWKRKK